MNRCFPARIGRALSCLAIVFGLAFVFSPGLANAQTALRQFPVAAQRGVLLVQLPPDVLINGSAARLAPGARILGVNNLLLLSASLVGQPLLVNYVRGHDGLIQSVWVLSEPEAREPRAGIEPRTKITFESALDQTQER